GLKAHSAVTKPLISRKNQKARLSFVEEHVVWTKENCSKVYFSDESKFNLCGSDGKHYVQRQTGERLNPKCVKKSVKSGGGSVMVWGMFSAAVVGPLIQIHGRMNAAKYRDILDENLLQSALDLRLGRRFTFQQDNDPKHTAKITKEWLYNNSVTVFEWTSQSSDSTNLWRDLKMAVHQRLPSNLTEMERICKVEWQRIPKSRCDLVFPKKTHGCIRLKG
ncbi:hypothetical protein C0J50_6038, partial [Silurus asotus]